MSMKHTPGPWFVTGSMTRYVEARIEGFLTQEVAACGPTAADEGYGPQQEANARLIAAAPDLLSIAMRLNALEGEWHPDRYQDEKDLLLKDARAAIKKATGEEA